MSKHCRDDGCATEPHFGINGSKKAEFCGRHATGDMVNLYAKKCRHGGCTTEPRFGINGSKQREFAADMPKEGMMRTVRNRTRGAVVGVSVTVLQTRGSAAQVASLGTRSNGNDIWHRR